MKATTLALSLLLAAGCSPSEEPAAVAAEPKFEGNVDASLVGEWATLDGSSRMSLRKDGSSRLTNHVVTGHGTPQDVSKDGKWLLSAGKLLIRSSGDDPSTMSFSFKRPTPDRLEVQRKTPPQPIVYLRKTEP